MLKTFSFQAGKTPILLSMPHNGSAIPAELSARMTPYAQLSPDTDWFMDRLYDFAAEWGVSVINPVYSRYVIDLNRRTDGQVLYPGADNTELCPTTCFDFRPIYQPGQEPDATEIQQRIHTYWQPYHQQLKAECQRLKKEHGLVVLYDAHSIASQVPRFFAGQLPDLNLGTADGHSCAATLEAALKQTAQAAKPYTHILNGRFKGGYITRHYAQPEEQIHTFQLELSQRTYLDESKRSYEPERASQIKTVLRHLFTTILEWIESQSTANIRGVSD